MSENSSWPPSSGLTTKVVPRKDAVLQISYSTIIHAPAPLVFDAILHVAEYALWNTWIPSARVLTNSVSSNADCDPDDLSHMRIGSIMTFDAIMDPKKPKNVQQTSLKVTDICTPSARTSYLSSAMLEDPTFTTDLSKVYRVSWTGYGGPYAFGMNLERFHEVIVTGENQCEVRNWEVFSGVLSRVVKFMYQDTLSEKVALWCEDLKKHCEKKHEKATTS
jgi:hypothetical protein